MKRRKPIIPISMKHLASKRLWFLAGLLAVTMMVSAGPSLRNLAIHVDLLDNGDAEITETWQISVDSEKTEWYIVIDNLNGRTITDFSVTDETGQKYTNVGDWDVKKSREWKTNKCGIVRKNNGCELCWGFGKSGERIYVSHYVVTDLVLDYEESDGFNWMFVTRDMDPAPQHVNMEIEATFRETGLPEDSVGVWIFGSRNNNIRKMENTVVASVSNMKSDESVILLMELKKGLLHPKKSGNCTFKELRKNAFKNSDYKEETLWRKAMNFLWENLEWLFTAVIVFFIAILTIFTSISLKRERKNLLNNLEWYREIPANGDLRRARNLMGAFYLTNPISRDNLINALVLRLLRTNTLRIEQHYVDATGLKKVFGGEGKYHECIFLGDFDSSNRLLSDASLKKLYDIIKEAAGEDGILQPKELKKWMNRHETEVMEFVRFLDKGSMKLKEAKRSIDDVQKVFGLKKFLEDFTLANERHLTEVSLWKDYLVYATLFGIADQVKADMKKVNPEFMNMDIETRNMTNETLVPVFASSLCHDVASVERSVSRDSGGGGHGSFGGGGGFSGGGSGGGAR